MTVETILSAVLIGAVLGVLGRLLVPGRNPIGCLLTIGVGILAALAGTLLAEAAGVETDGWSWAEFGIQVLVAAFGVALLTGFSRKRS
ncbi:GlsB/YeaQ/YmgE family stress response membrane protein [Aquipuribacter sp. MA13-6]|uniref:GlsB/YeaQ/YmgE family stress response membrane protein n=1 Tax=unclassified Aquipuribacter TaxID=2635084 RepID=UPI003EE91F78